MTIKRLKPLPATNILEHQCDAVIGSDMKSIRLTAWRQNKYGKQGLDPTKCCRMATVDFGGTMLCATHAGIRALEVLLGERET